MLPVVSPAVLRWVIGLAGSVCSAVAVAMSGGTITWQMVATAVGAALIGSLKNLPDTVKLSELPKGFQLYLESIRNSEPPAVVTSTPTVDDVTQ